LGKEAGMTRNPFAEVPEDVNAVVSLVTRAARDECDAESCLIYPVLDRCAADAVSSVWDSRVKTFVPLLALRRVRECIKAGTCDSGV
jgi:hypothetical protein